MHSLRKTLTALRRRLALQIVLVLLLFLILKSAIPRAGLEENE
jgi:hypothetical protein